MRATVDGLGSPYPIGTLLPGLFQDDDLVQRFTGALDVVLAPVVGVLDSGDAYVDPRLAPLDFVAWLAQWVGVELDGSWPEERQRALVARSAELYAWRGTVRGVSELVELYTGEVPEIEDTGGVAWTASPPPAGQLPGTPAAGLVVRVRVPAGEAGTVDAARLDRLVAAAKPAHVTHRVEVLERRAPRRRRPATPAAPPAPPEPGSGADLDDPWTQVGGSPPPGSTGGGAGRAPAPGTDAEDGPPGRGRGRPGGDGPADGGPDHGSGDPEGEG